MIIKNRNFPNIGRIRNKQLPGKEPRWQLTIYPPGGHPPLMGHEPASFVELNVSQEEAERIERVAPHLLSSRVVRADTDDSPKGLPPKKRPGKAKGAQRVASGANP